MKRAGLYVRVSTEEQKKHGLSVDSQITALEAYCKANNIKPYKIYNDAGISARKRYTKRTALLELIEDCKAKNIDVILFTKLDRWFRSVADYYEVQNQLDDCHVPWRAIWEDYETETANGVLKVNIMLSVAQSEADRTSERIKAVLDYKKQKGEHVGWVAYGLKRIDKKYLVRDKGSKAEKELELMFESYMRTRSARQTYKILRDNGYDVSYTALLQKLKNPVYCQIDDPYITKEQHERILETISQKVRAPKGTKYLYLFNGLVRCDLCGSAMAGKRNQSGCKSYACVFSCKNSKHDFSFSLSERLLEKRLINQLDESVSEYNYKIISKSKEKDISDQISALTEKKKRIGVRFEIGEIDIDDYKEKINQINIDIDKLKSELKTDKKIELPSNWKEIYYNLSDENKKSFWNKTVKSILISPYDRENPKIIL